MSIITENNPLFGDVIHVDGICYSLVELSTTDEHTINTPSSAVWTDFVDCDDCADFIIPFYLFTTTSLSTDILTPTISGSL
jgi:hypothetical protein